MAAVVDLFKGQASSVSPFTVGKLDIIDYAQDSVFGYGNTLTLTAEEITRNLHEVQQRNLLPLTEPEQLRFNIEMETGTGKTFVYTKTIYELNKRYGFNKFVILVPSVAIREGAYKSLQITEEYFRQEYDGKRAHFFIYDSKKRNEVRDFALSTNLEIMIVNIDAIKKDENLFNQESDKMDKTAREFMAQCRPILIIDEPQSIDNTEKSRKAIENLNPLCELRYSATHKQVFNTVYRLTPVDAYQMNIVKQIFVVASVLVPVKIVRPHDSPGSALLYGRLECRKIYFIEGPVIHYDIAGMAVYFVVVQCKMLYAGCDSVGLDPFDVRDYHLRCQEGVLAHIFEIPSVQRCPVYVHSRSEQDGLVPVSGLLSDTCAVKV